MAYCLVVGKADKYLDIAGLMGKGMGCDVEVVNDWLSAVKLFRENIPDFVVVDIQDIEAGDMQHLATLRKLPGGASSHIIVCCNDNSERAAEQAVKMGASSYLSKPYYPKQLMEKFLESTKF